MSHFYNRPYKVPVWIVLNNLGPKRTDSIISQVIAEGGFEQPWPANSFVNTLNKMNVNGWKHVLGQKKPFILDVNFVPVAVTKHLQEMFGASVYLTGTHARPYQQALNRKVEKDEDYARIFNDVMALEQDVELSRIFGLANPKSRVYISEGPVKKELLDRIADQVITVGTGDTDTVNVEKKNTKAIKAAIDAELVKRGIIEAEDIVAASDATDDDVVEESVAE